MPETSKPKSPRRLRRWFLFGGIALIVALLGAVALIFSPAGKRRVQAIIEAAASDAERGESLSLGTLSYSPRGGFFAGPVEYRKGDELAVRIGSVHGRAGLLGTLLGRVHLSQLKVENLALEAVLVEEPPPALEEVEEIPAPPAPGVPTRAREAQADLAQRLSFLSFDHVEVENLSLRLVSGDRALAAGKLNLVGRDFPHAFQLEVEHAPGATLEMVPGKDWPALALGLSSNLRLTSADLAGGEFSGTLGTLLADLPEAVARGIAVGTAEHAAARQLALLYRFDLKYAGEKLEIAELAVEINEQPWLSVAGHLEARAGRPVLRLSGRTQAPLRLPLALLSEMDSEGRLKADGELRIERLEFALRPTDEGGWSLNEDVRLSVKSLSGPANLSGLELVARAEVREHETGFTGEGSGSFALARLEKDGRRLESLTGQLSLTAGAESSLSMHLTGDYSDTETALRMEAQARARLADGRQESRLSSTLTPRRLPRGLPARPIKLLAEASGPADFSAFTFKTLGGEWDGVLRWSATAAYDEQQGVTGKLEQLTLQQADLLWGGSRPAGVPALPEITAAGDFSYHPRSGRASLSEFSVDAPGLLSGALSGRYDGRKAEVEIAEVSVRQPARLIPPGAALPPLPALDELRLSGSLSYAPQSARLEIPRLSIKGAPSLDTTLTGYAVLSGKPTYDVKIAETDLELAPFAPTLSALADQEMELGGRLRVSLSASGTEGRLTRAEAALKMEGARVRLASPAASLDPLTGQAQFTAAPVGGNSKSLKVEGAIQLHDSNARYADAGQSAALSGLSGELGVSGSWPEALDATWKLSASGVEVSDGTLPIKSDGPLTTEGKARLADGELARLDGAASLTGGSVVLEKEGVAISGIHVQLSGDYDPKSEKLAAQWNLSQASVTSPNGDAVFIDGLKSSGAFTQEGKALRVRKLALSATQPNLKVEIPEGSGDPSQLRAVSVTLDSPERRTVYPQLKVGGQVEAPLQLALEPLAAKGTLRFSNFELDSNLTEDIRLRKVAGTLPIDSAAAPLSDAQLASLSAPKGDAYQPNLTIAEAQYEKRKIKDIRAEISVKDQSVLIPRLVCLVETPGLKLPHRLELWGWAQMVDETQRYRFEGNVKAPSLLDPVLSPVVRPALGLKDNSVEAGLGAAYSVAFEIVKYTTAEEPDLSFSAAGPGGTDIIREIFGIEAQGEGGLPLVGDPGGAVRILRTGGKLRMLVPELPRSSTPQAESATPEARQERRSPERQLIDTGRGLLEGVLGR